MQIEIYTKTPEKDADSQRKEYTNFLFKNNEKIVIDRVLDYISSTDFAQYKTVKTIQSLNISCLNDLIKKYGEKVVYEEILNIPNLKKLFKKSPKIAMRLYDLNCDEKLDEDINTLAGKFLLFDHHFKLIENLL